MSKKEIGSEIEGKEIERKRQREIQREKMEFDSEKNRRRERI